MDNQKINIALCSYGMSGRVFHAPFIDVHPHLHLVSCWERSEKRIQQHYPYCSSVGSYQDVLKDNTIELIVVNTPTYTHFDYASQALQAGKHVIIEKAVTTNASEAHQLKKLAQQNNRHIFVYQNRRWDSDFLTVKKVVESNQLGQINEAEIHFDRYNLAMSPKQHKEVPNDGAGIVRDLGPHIIDQALVLFGMPKQVFALVRNTRPQTQVDDYVEALLIYTDKVVKVKASYIVPKALPSYILHGTHGTFLKTRADVQEKLLQENIKPNATGYAFEPETESGKLFSVQNNHLTEQIVKTEVGNYYHFYDAVYQCLKHGKPNPVSIDEGINVMTIIDAIFESASTKKVIDIPIV